VKHTLTFLVLLALILSIGYYSAGFSELTLKNNENKSIKLTRDDSESNAVFFSGSENGFDPMSLVVPCSPDQETGPDIRTDIAAAMIAVLSRYTPKNEYIKGTEIPIEMAMKRSSNNYIYTEGYSYINPYGDERVLDCILDADDFDIVYIRYRSAQESEPDPIQAKNALEKFSGFSDDVENDYDMINDFMSNLSLLISDSGYADYWDLINNYGYSITYSDFDALYACLNGLYDTAETIQQSSNLLTRFFSYSCIFALLTVLEEGPIPDDYYDTNRTYYITGGTGTAPLVPYMLSETEPEYTLLGDSIFETISFRHLKLITIYSISDECIEGYYADLT